jgi:DNA-binding transcriptional LysR family regulator
MASARLLLQSLSLTPELERQMTVLAESGSFKQAARQLGISPQGVFDAFRRLERRAIQPEDPAQ